MGKRGWLAERLESSGATEVMLRARSHLGSTWLPVLTFHRVIDSGGRASALDRGVVDATPAELEATISVLTRYFTPIGLSDLARFFEGGWLPHNPALLTFDDGYLDNHDVVLPILRRHHMRAVFFIATGYLTARRVFWWDRIAYLLRESSRAQLELSYPRPLVLSLRSPEDRESTQRVLLRLVKTFYDLDLERFLTELSMASGVVWDRALERDLAEATLMTWDHVRELRANGMEIQSHTRSHRVLETLPAHEIAYELAASRADLERELGETPTAISYPTGHSLADRADVLDAVRAAGFQLAFTNDTGPQPIRRDADRYDLRRIGRDLGTSDALLRATLALPGVFA